MGRRQHGLSQTDCGGETTLAGLQRQHDGKDALSNWRSPPRPVAKSAEQGSRITGAPRKSVEGERVSEGLIVAVKRSNVRGAKEPCCLVTAPTKREARVK
jgi:hypothetical protein